MTVSSQRNKEQHDDTAMRYPIPVPVISAADEARLDDLYRQLKHARTDMKMVARTYTNGIRYDADQRVIDDARQCYAEEAARYNQIVDDINALTASQRTAQRAANKRAAMERREVRQAAERAALHAAACEGCGTIHAGEC